MSNNQIKGASHEDHKAYHRRILYVFILILIFLFGGATFYHYIEHWDYIDALYFSTATMTTVGYGDITPHSTTGKLFTIVYVFSGVGIVLYGLSIMTSHFVEMREEFWMEKIGKIKLRYGTQSIWQKIKNRFFYNADEILEDEETKKKSR